MRGLIALLCGMVFGIGLAVSGMTDTAKVLGFLDIFGTWVPDLAFVMGAAVCVTLVTFPFILKKKKPLLSAVSRYRPRPRWMDACLAGPLSLALAGEFMATARDQRYLRWFTWTTRQ